MIESPAERTLNRFEAYLEQKRRHEPDTAVQITSAPETLRYRLSTEVPDYWIPLMPMRVGQGLRLQRGAVLKTDGSLENVLAPGRILEAGQWTPDLAAWRSAWSGVMYPRAEWSRGRLYYPSMEANRSR